MSNLFKRGGLAILGLVAVLAYWSLSAATAHRRRQKGFRLRCGEGAPRPS